MKQSLPRVKRWVRPAWLDWQQAQIYSDLPLRVLHGLVANRLLRTRRRGKLLKRDSLDQVLLQASLNGEPVFFGTEES